MLDYKGKYVPYVPQHTMAAMADYRLTDWLTLGANVNAQGKTYWDNEYLLPKAVCSFGSTC